MSVAMDRRSFLTRSAATVGGIATAGTVVDVMLADIASAATPGVDGGHNVGGDLTVGIQSEAPAKLGFSGSQGKLDASGFCIAQTVYDGLFAASHDGTKFLPMLALSATADKTFTQWTITLRQGVKFHNGDAFNADAVMYNAIASFVDTTVGLAAIPLVTSVTKLSDYKVLYTTRHPWASFPLWLSQSQVNFMAHKSTFKTVTAAKVAALSANAVGGMPIPAAVLTAYAAYCPFGQGDATTGGGKPIGTGPFQLNNVSDWEMQTKSKWYKNTSYWRKDAGGRALPYLNSVTHKVIVDPASRLQALQAGTVQLIVTPDGQSIRSLKAGINGISSRTDQNDPRDPAINSIIMNCWSQATIGTSVVRGAVNPSTLQFDSSLRSPTSDLGIRKAIIMAINRTTYFNVVDGGTGLTMDGVYRPTSKYYVANHGYPTTANQVNIPAATALVNAYKSAHGISGNLKIVMDTIQGSSAGDQGFTIIAGMLLKVGIELVQRKMVASDLINAKIGKTYDLSAWAQFGGIDPSENFVWFNSNKLYGTQSPNFVNFAQQADPLLENAMLSAMAAPMGSAAVITGWKLVNARMAVDLPYAWLDSTVNAWAARSNVKNWAFATDGTGKAQTFSPTGGSASFTEIYLA